MVSHIREGLSKVLENRNICPTITVWFDGACEPKNPGGVATCGWVIKQGDETLTEGCCEVCRGPKATNNVAEWSALGFALRWVLDNRGTSGQFVLRIFGDSQLVVNQLTGEWRCKKEHLRKYLNRCKAIIEELKPASWHAEWIPREQNEEADALSRKAYVEATGQSFPERVR